VRRLASRFGILSDVLQIAAALTPDTKSASSASSALQQQVVNGWTARDLLTIQSYTANDQLAVTKAETVVGAEYRALRWR
jgi:hypothetical protein